MQPNCVSHTEVRRPFDKGCATSHRLNWDPFPPNEVGRIAQHIRMGEGRNGRKGRDKIESVYQIRKDPLSWSHGLLVGRYHQLLPGFFAKDHFSRVSHQNGEGRESRFNRDDWVTV